MARFGRAAAEIGPHDLSTAAHRRALSGSAGAVLFDAERSSDKAHDARAVDVARCRVAGSRAITVCHHSCRGRQRACGLGVTTERGATPMSGSAPAGPSPPTASPVT